MKSCKLFMNLTVSLVWCFLGLSMSVVVIFSFSVGSKQNEMNKSETADLLNKVKNLTVLTQVPLADCSSYHIPHMKVPHIALRSQPRIKFKKTD